MRKILVGILLPLRPFRMFFELSYVSLSNKSMGKFKIHHNGNKSIYSRKLLHIVPFSLLDAPNLHGSSKDINHLEEYLIKRGDIEITRLYCERGWRAAKSVIAANKSMKFWLNSHHIVLINLPGKTGMLSFALRCLMARNRPIVARSHNAEFFHHLEMAGTHRTMESKLRAFVYAITCLISDFWTARICDYVFVISQFDLENYWIKLTKNVLHVPYKPRDIFEGKDRCIKSKTIKKVVSVGSAKKGGRIALDQELMFYDYAREYELPADFQFCQTNAQRKDLAPHNVVALPYVDDFAEFMSTAVVILVCGKAGWGEKTKISDAVYSGLPVVLEEEVFYRVDEMYRVNCFAFGPNARYPSFNDALCAALSKGSTSKKRLETLQVNIEKGVGEKLKLGISEIIDNVYY